METKTYSAKELAQLKPGELNAILMKAVKIEGTALVTDKDGKPKYDQPELQGTYGEENL